MEFEFQGFGVVPQGIGLWVLVGYLYIHKKICVYIYMCVCNTHIDMSPSRSPNLCAEDPLIALPLLPALQALLGAWIVGRWSRMNY